MKISLPLVVLALALTVTCSVAQIQKDEAPKSRSMKNGRAGLNIKSIALAEISNEDETLKAKKMKDECKSCRKDFYGKPIAVQVNVKKDATMIETDDGYLWIMKFNSKSAKGMQFYFDEFELPAGATLHVYNDDQSYTMGAFTKDNNNPVNKFATRIFPGKSATLEYFEPKNVEFKGSLKLNKVVHVFLDIAGDGDRSAIMFGESGSCTVNVNCSSGSVLSTAKKAVGLITYWDPQSGYNALCTGSLMNSTGSNTFKKPLLMTAAHCVSDKHAGYYFDYIMYFNYENQGCTQDFTNPFFSATSFQGAYLRSVGDEVHMLETDYALLEMYNKPQVYTSVYYLGWDRRNTLSSGGTFNISHPWGDAKKIAIDYDSPTKISQISHACLSSYPFQAWSVDWNEGVTQPGSSGSPLLNGFKRVIGVLSGGDSRCSDSPGKDFCNNTTAHGGPDWFSRMDYAWNHANPGIDEMYYYLDPDNSNPDYIDGWDPGTSTPSGFLRIRDIQLTTDHWEDVPMLVPGISTTEDISKVTYSWTPAEDFFDANVGAPFLFFGGTRPVLPLTKTYTLVANSPGGFSDTKSITVTIYDCENKTINLSVCSQGNIALGYDPVVGETYSWSPAANLSSTTASKVTFNPPAPGSYTFAATVTSPECTRTEIYNVATIDPPGPPTFTPVKTADARFGGTGADYPSTILYVNNQIVVSGGTVHTSSGDHLTERREPPADVNTTEEMVLNLDNALTNLNNFSVYNTGYALNSPIASSSSGLYFLTQAGLRKTDFSGRTIWNSAIGGSDFRCINVATRNDGGAIVGYNRMGQVNFIESRVVLVGSGGSATTTKISTTNKLVKINRTSDDGAIALFFTFFNATTGIRTYWLTKYDNTLTQQWTKPFQTKDEFDISSTERFNLLQTQDGGYILGGASFGDNGETANSAKLVKFNSTGQVVWSKAFPDGKLAVVKETLDGGLMVGCNSTVGAGPYKTEAGRGLTDYWVFKLDANGVFQGDKTIGGNKDDKLSDLVQVDVNTFILLGNSNSGVSGDKTQGGYGAGDLWVVKLVHDPNATVLPPSLSSSLTPPKVCTGIFDYTPTSKTSGVTFSWERAAIAGISEPASYGVGPISESLTNTTSANITVTYVVTTTNFLCRSSTQNVKVVVRPQSLSVLPAVISPVSPMTVCGSVRLDAPVKANCTNCTYEWKTADGAVISTQSFLDVTTTGNYIVKMINGTCSSTSDSAQVTVNPVPVATLSPGGPIVLCNGESVKLTANTGTGLTYKWYKNDRMLSTTSSSLTVQYDGEIEYNQFEVVVKNSFGCEKSAGEMVQSIVPKITQEGQFCAGGSVVLNASATWIMPLAQTVYVFTWQEYKSLGWTTIGTGPSITVSKAAKYRVKASSQFCTSISDTYVLTALTNPKPSISMSGDVCIDGDVTLTSSSASSYSWSNGLSGRSISGFEGDTYSVSVVYANGCSNVSYPFTVPYCEPVDPDPCQSSLMAGGRSIDFPLPCLELAEVQVENIAVFPNPTDKELVLQLPASVEFDVSVKMFSQFGQVVHTGIIRKGEISLVLDTKSIINGVYLIELKLTDKKTFNRKVMVLHKN